MTSITKQMDLAYSFGGTREEPLVKGIVAFTYDTHVHACLQEALLERTELLLDRLSMTFDDALRAFDCKDTRRSLRIKALDTMISTVVFTTKNILVQSPGVHYVLMFTRIQEVFRREEVIQKLFGADAALQMLEILKPIWVDLRAIDNSFGVGDEGGGESSAAGHGGGGSASVSEEATRKLGAVFKVETDEDGDGDGDDDDDDGFTEDGEEAEDGDDNE